MRMDKLLENSSNIEHTVEFIRSTVSTDSGAIYYYYYYYYPRIQAVLVALPIVSDYLFEPSLLCGFLVLSASFLVHHIASFFTIVFACWSFSLSSLHILLCSLRAWSLSE